MTIELPLFAEPDVCARKHGGDAESRAAHRAGDKRADRQQVLDFIRARLGGATLDEVCVGLDREPNQISGRITELKRDGHLSWTGGRRTTRSGCSAKVYVAI